MLRKRKKNKKNNEKERKGDVEIAIDEKHGDRSPTNLLPIFTTTLVITIFICEQITNFWHKTTRRCSNTDFNEEGRTQEGFSRLLLNFVKLSRVRALLFLPRKYR